jgi:hypothetical protein
VRPVCANSAFSPESRGGSPRWPSSLHTLVQTMSLTTGWHGLSACPPVGSGGVARDLSALCWVIPFTASSQAYACLCRPVFP